jgi:hypothetical protein
MRTPSARDLSVAALLAAGLAAGLWVAWSRLGLPPGVFTPGLTGHGPDPFLWRRFLVVWLPLAQLAFAVGYWTLARGTSEANLRRHFLLDQGLIALIVPLLLAVRAASAAGPWRPTLAAGYGLFVVCKTTLFLHGLWRWLGGRRAVGAGGVGAVGLGSLIPYLLLAGSVVTTTSAIGDEPYYLLTAHSLIRDGDADLANNLDQRDYLSFYWGRLASAQQTPFLAPVQDSLRQFSGLQPLLLVPGYWVGGRTGALVTVSVLAAAALALAFRLALVAGAGLQPAYLAWLGAAFSAPVVSLATSTFVEMPAALFLIAAVSGVVRDRWAWPIGVWATGCLAALMALKNRFVVMAMPVLLGLLPRATRRQRVWLCLLVAGAVAGVLYYDARVMGGAMGTYLRAGGPLGIKEWAAHTLLGFLLDQEYGLLTSGPAFGLGLLGAVVALRERRYQLALVTFGPFAATWALFGLGVGATYGGTAPPARFLAASLPLLAVLSAFAYARVRGRVLWALVASLLSATFLYSVILSLWPAWRYENGAGRNTLLAQIWEWTGLDLGRLLPSFLPPRPSWSIAAAVVILALAGVGWWLAGRPGQAPPQATAALGALILVVCIGAGVGFVWWRPWGTFPASGWRGRGGMVFEGLITTVGEGDVTATPRIKGVWAVQRQAIVAVAPWLPAGRYRLIVRAGATGPLDGPRLTVRAADTVVHEATLAAAPPPAWRSADYAGEVVWSGGRLPVALEFTDVSAGDPIRLAYVEHLRIERLGP